MFCEEMPFLRNSFSQNVFFRAQTSCEFERPLESGAMIIIESAVQYASLELIFYLIRILDVPARLNERRC